MYLYPCVMGVIMLFKWVKLPSGCIVPGSSVLNTLMDTDDNLSKRALLGMVSFYKAVIKYLQDNLPLDNELLKALTCLNPREQNSLKSKEYCKTCICNALYHIG